MAIADIVIKSAQTSHELFVLHRSVNRLAKSAWLFLRKCTVFRPIAVLLPVADAQVFRSRDFIQLVIADVPSQVLRSGVTSAKNAPTDSAYKPIIASLCGVSDDYGKLERFHSELHKDIVDDGTEIVSEGHHIIREIDCTEAVCELNVGINTVADIAQQLSRFVQRYKVPAGPSVFTIIKFKWTSQV